ncbi:MAG: electron transfer flavoprotein subunit beta/FixA family protein [Anaerolineales bacterium]|nr:MAG: electron transfer flavoprotein subunit beta/FixA family protein [Anaerolineales bacterium]
MPELRQVVCMKVVPKPEEIRVDYETGLLKRASARSEINPPDMNALEMALSLKDFYGGRLEIISMGPPYFEPVLRAGLAMGADHLTLLSDAAFAGADTLATTYTLAQGIRKLGGADLIFCGEESSDGATGQVPPGLAEWLEVPQLTLLTALELDIECRVARGRREIKGGYEVLEVPLPCVVSVKTASNEPRFMDYRRQYWASEAERLKVWNAEDLSADPDCIGLTGSPTTVSGLAEAASRERRRQFLTGTPSELATQIAELLQKSL